MFGSAQAATSLALITRYGQDVTFTRPTGAFNPVTGERADPDPVSFLGKGVRLTNYKGIKFDSMDDAFKKALITGKAIGIIVAAEGLATAPEPGDTITLADSTEWLVAGVTVLNPAGVPIIHTIGATKR